jgi:hypothetical protein
VDVRVDRELLARGRPAAREMENDGAVVGIV